MGEQISRSEITESINLPEIRNRALTFLETQQENGRFSSQVSNSADMSEPQVSPKEVASTLLVFDTALQQHQGSPIFSQSLSYLKSQLDNGRYHFFEDPSLLPADTETTSYGLTSLLKVGAIDREIMQRTADEIIRTTNQDGVIQVYFEPCSKENQIDHASAVNILTFLNLIGKGKQAQKTEDWVLEQLETNEYSKGSRYYHSPDTFLYFLGRMVEQCPNMKDRFREPLKKAVQSRVGMTEASIEMAMRSTTLTRLGEKPTELNKLLEMQKEDGGWDSNSIYHYGGKVGYFGSRAITTTFVVEAIDKAERYL